MNHLSTEWRDERGHIIPPLPALPATSVLPLAAAPLTRWQRIVRLLH